MKGLLITKFYNLAVPAVGRGFELAPGCFVTSDWHFVEKLLSPHFVVLAGRLAVDELAASSAVFYTRLELSRALPPAEITQILEHFLRTANQICTAMWFVKDNAILASEGYYQLIQANPGPGTFVTQHTLGIYYWNALGQQSRLTFDVDELRRARGYLSELPERLGLPSGPLMIHPTLPPNVPRLGRAWYILENARMTTDVAIRVANYVTCLEALFSTETQELTHILSERVANFLGDSSAERREIFEATKTAYKIRSKVLHGDELQKKHREMLSDVSLSCDSLVRRSLLKVLGSDDLVTKFNGKKEPLEEYFAALIFR